MSPKSIIRLIVACIVILYTFNLKGQVTGVNYQIRFNPDNCLYEARLIIKSGSAVSALQRAQFSAQYSIVVPASSTLNLVANHMPLQNNQNYGGTQPTTWFVSSYIQNPAALPGYDFYSVTPSLTPTSFYNNLQAGDTVRLFSFSVDPLPPCGFGVRPFENGVDPGSGAPGMGGGDFTNGFTIGGPAQKYEGNEPTIYGKKPLINQFEFLCIQGIAISLNASATGCQAPLSYQWSGPMDYNSTNQSISIPNATHLNNGNYQVIISDNIGCRDTLSMFATAKPQAGPDQNVQCHITGSATIATAGPGVWSTGSNSAGTAVISDVQNPVITVNAFSAPGNYFLIKTLNNCPDTTVIYAGNQCDCGITNTIQQPTSNTYCGQSPAFQITGNNSTVQGTYLWQYRLNNQSFGSASGVNNQQNYTTPALNPGTHSFRRIFSKSGSPECIDTSNIVVIIVGEQPNAGQDHTLLCHQNTSVTMNASGTGYWYLGTGSAGSLQISSVTNPAATLNAFSGPGTYYMVWANMYCRDTSVITIQNLCGCENANAGPDKNICAGSKTLLEGTCSIGVWTAHPSNPAGSTLTSLENGVAQVNFSTNAQGAYRYIFNIGESLRDTMQINVFTLPVIDAGQDFDYCAGSPPVTIVAGGAQSYIWSTGQTGSSITVSPTNSSTYIVTGTNSNGCSATDTIKVTVLPRPSGSIPSPPPCYENDNMQLMAGQWSNAMSYAWSGPMNFNSTVQNPVVQNVTLQHSGTYYLTVTSPDDCWTTASVHIQILQRPLPVEWLSFDGRHLPEKRANQLNWTTAAERNNDYFALERSMDGIDFIEIAKIQGTGNILTGSAYTFSDYSIQSGLTHYYRIKQVDYDGRFSVSHTIAVFVPGNIFSDDLGMELYPNPAVNYGNLYIKNRNAENVHCTIVNASGNVIFARYFERIMPHQNMLEGVDFTHWNSGVYIVRLMSDHFQIQRKWVIQK